MTAKAFFERLYLVLGLALICALCHYALGAHFRTARSAAISRFRCNPVAPQFFGLHDLPLCPPLLFSLRPLTGGCRRGQYHERVGHISTMSVLDTSAGFLQLLLSSSSLLGRLFCEFAA